MTAELVRYDAACRALTEARSVDEVKDIRDKAVAMACYARQAQNRSLEADAVEIRMRATRKLDELRQAQKETVGLAKGGGGKHGRKRVIEKPTLESQGIGKNLAQQARVLGKLSDEGFEKAVTKARAKVTHRRARKHTEREREAARKANQQILERMTAGKNKKEERALRRSGIEPTAISEVAYKVIRADLQAARELYRILVAGGGHAACRFVRELAAGLENERKTTLVRMQQQAEIEAAGTKAKSELDRRDRRRSRGAGRERDRGVAGGRARGTARGRDRARRLRRGVGVAERALTIPIVFQHGNDQIATASGWAILSAHRQARGHAVGF
jgi:hypothetical protein